MNGDESNLENLRAELKKTLADYEKKLETCKTDIERKIILNTIAGFMKQLKELDSGGENQAKKKKKKDQKVKTAMLEIFDFYSKQQKAARKVGTFSDYNDDFKKLSVGE